MSSGWFPRFVPQASRLRGPARSATAWVGALGFALVAAACTELERPEAYSPAPPVSLSPDGSETPEDVAPDTPREVGVEEFVPNPPADYSAQLLVATDQGVIGSGAGVDAPIPALVDRPSVAAYDDLGGGVVLDEGDAVVYIPAQGDPVVIDDIGSSLLDVGYWGGAPRAFLQVGLRRIDRIQLVSEKVDERERVEHIQLAVAESIVDVSASRGLQAVIVEDEACGGLHFFDVTGEEIRIAGPPDPECTFPGRPSYGAVAISPDGEAVAYTIVTYRADGTEAATDLNIRELVSGRPFFERKIGENLDRVRSLTFDGTRVAFIKDSANATTVATIDVTTSKEQPVDTLGAEPGGSLSFARIPLSLDR